MKLAVWVFALALAACGASARERTIATALATTNVAAATFEKFDGIHQGAIVAKATSLEEGKAALADYRKDQVKVEALLAGLYRAIATAATLEDDHSLVGIVSAAKLLQDELHALGVL